MRISFNVVITGLRLYIIVYLNVSERLTISGLDTVQTYLFKISDISLYQF